jgi:hypothetical protein
MGCSHASLVNLKPDPPLRRSIQANSITAYCNGGYEDIEIKAFIIIRILFDS